MRDTGFVYTPDDAHRAQDMLDEFAGTAGGMCGNPEGAG